MMNQMLRYQTAFIIALMLLVSDDASAAAWNKSRPPDYGKVVIKNHVKQSGFAPVVFDHWVHRSQFTCRLCHVDIGFTMSSGGTDITAAANKQGLYCGACHDGKRIFNGKQLFAACSDNVPKEGSSRCDRCHSLGKKVARERDFAAFAEKLPKEAFGNKINWEEAEAKGLIKLTDFLEGVSIKRPPLKQQKDFSVEVKASWIGEVVFSHKKHSLWNGCEVCHPEIFPNVQKGSTKYSMFQIINGQYCGVCHDRVAFPLQDCQRCHVKPVEIKLGTPAPVSK